MFAELGDSGSARRRPPPASAVLEAARLAALQAYRGLDGESLASLDRVAEHAAASFAAGRASVCFVDDAFVWPAGSSGFEVDDIMRDGSFCDVVVRGGIALLVADAQGDPRFRAHALVQPPIGVRSYAGVPLVDEGGYVLGTVALFSAEVGAFELDVLADLAKLARVIEAFLGRALAPGLTTVSGRQGWLGVRTIGSCRGGRKRAGLVVLSVAEGSPAERAGLRPTDILHSIDGRALFEPADVVAALAGAPPTVCLRYQRAGAWHECSTSVLARNTAHAL